MMFEFAATNLVIEPGIVMAILLGCHLGVVSGKGRGAGRKDTLGLPCPRPG